MKKINLSILAVAGLLAGTTILAGCGPYQLTEAEQTATELGARDFAEPAGGTYVSCSGQDSDGDGYVTCSVSLKDASGKAVETDLACSYRSRGCKRK